MTSAWGLSWGGAWGNSWGPIASPSPGGTSQGVPVGWGSGRRHGIAGYRDNDIKIERRVNNKFDKLRIQEIDNHDIMLFAKTFRQYRK